MVKDTILYDRLGVSPSVTDKDLKKAYRKASLKWHPDKNKDNSDEATKKFQEISEAYSILNDIEKRKIYDQVGIEMLKHGSEGPQVDPMSMFAEMFGGMGGFPGFGGFGGFGRREEPEEEHCVVKLPVSLEQIYNEEKVTVSYKQKIYCSTCNGNGTKDGKKSVCNSCDGKGKVMQVRRMGPMVHQTIVDCPECKGKGNSITKSNMCKKCNGKTYTEKKKSYDIPLKNGIKSGNKIKVDNKGHQFKNKKTHLIIIIIEKEHETFKRDNDNLIIEMEIKLYQSLLGFTKILKHLDGRIIEINNCDIIKDGDIKVISNEGMNNLNGYQKGDLYIKFKVKYPSLSKLKDEEKNILKVLLAKDEIKELTKEEDIKNKKYKTTKVYLHDINTHSSHEEERHQPQCVHQ
jgi:DnaJ homolog subfamily A member 2